MLGAAFASGLAASGVDVAVLGCCPTPTVSHAARSGAFDFGAVISASHNPAEDNGIKLLDSLGKKLPEEIEREIECALMREPQPTSNVGRIASHSELVTAYEDWLLSLAGDGIQGLRVAVDCANGAASGIFPSLLRRLGAEVVATGDSPDGDNINRACGATHPQVVQRLTTESAACLGISFDGDADRCVFSDERGQLINGDKFMSCWAAHQDAVSTLSPRIVVGTVMSNMGFEHALKGIGVQLERTPVGDRFVASRMNETGAVIGGEQSGHIILREHAPTGDGLLTALQMIRVLIDSRKPASQLNPIYENWPQLLVNIRVVDKNHLDSEPVRKSISDAEALLGDDGRIVVRPSGTQSMVRVMVEGKQFELRNRAADWIVHSILTEMNGEIQSKVELTNALGD